MRTTIDAAGRLVIPKPLRDELGLRAGQPLEVSAREGRLEIEVEPATLRLAEEEGAVTAVPAEPLPPLTQNEVRATLERVRR